MTEMTPPADTLDAFAGFGWGIALTWLGLTEDGIEIMSEARSTRAANGLHTVARDVTEYRTAPGRHRRQLGSPPCKTFTFAGSGAGRRALDHVLNTIKSIGAGADPLAAIAALKAASDGETALVVEPLRLALEGMPEFIAWEQVRSVLPVWQEAAPVLEAAGYSVATGILRTEQFGVPQTRERAILVARRDGKPARLPVPTHSRYYPTNPGRLDPGVLPWVTISEAIGIPEDAYLISNYGTGGDPAARGIRYGYQPAATITSKADRIKICFPGSDLTGPRTFRNLTREEAAMLQTIPADFHVIGRAAKVGEQIGNVVPPALAREIVKALISDGPCSFDGCGKATAYLRHSDGLGAGWRHVDPADEAPTHVGYPMSR